VEKGDAPVWLLLEHGLIEIFNLLPAFGRHGCEESRRQIEISRSRPMVLPGLRITSGRTMFMDAPFIYGRETRNSYEKGKPPTC
jgi:hypothetical protein